MKVCQLLTPLAVLAALALPTACRPERAPRPDVDVELPPALAGTRAAATPPPAPDPAGWRIPPPADGDLPVLRLAYGQDLRGELEPCGCPGAPTGGLARRATFVRDLRAALPDVRVLEGPTAIGRARTGREALRPEERARARVVLDLLARGGAEAFFPGHADFAVLPPRELAVEAERVGLPLIATDLAPSARPPGVRDALILTVGARRVVVLGLLGTARSDVELAAAPTIDAVVAAREALLRAGPADVVLAFTAAESRERRGWRAAGLPVDVVLAPFELHGAPSSRWDGAQLEVVADPLGRALRRLDVAFTGRDPGVLRAQAEEARIAAAATQEATWLAGSRRLAGLTDRVEAGVDPRVKVRGLDGIARVDPDTDPDAVRLGLATASSERARHLSGLAASTTARHVAAPGLLLLAPELPDDADARAAIAAFHDAFLADLAATVAAAPPPANDGRYVGLDACVGCHPGPSGHWPTTRHASAFRTLVERGAHRNPDCLGCHATGFGLPGGFVDVDGDRRLVNVQCEACHGPMGRHVLDAQTTGFRPAADPTVPVERCRACHDAKNSPNFDPATYRPRVLHRAAP